MVLIDFCRVNRPPTNLRINNPLQSRGRCVTFLRAENPAHAHRIASIARTIWPETAPRTGCAFFLSASAERRECDWNDNTHAVNHIAHMFYTTALQVAYKVCALTPPHRSEPHARATNGLHAIEQSERRACNDSLSSFMCGARVSRASLVYMFFMCSLCDCVVLRGREGAAKPSMVCVRVCRLRLHSATVYTLCMSHSTNARRAH